MCRPAQGCRGCGPFGTRLGKLITFINIETYHYAIVAHQFVKAGRVCLALVVRTTLRSMPLPETTLATSSRTEDFPTPSSPNKKDSLWRFRLVVRLLDKPLFEGHYVTRKYSQNYYCINNVVVTYLTVEEWLSPFKAFLGGHGQQKHRWRGNTRSRAAPSLASLQAIPSTSHSSTRLRLQPTSCRHLG